MARQSNSIDTIPLMEALYTELLGLLHELTPEQWDSPTSCAGWTVKDVAAHLLDGNQRRLSICRDGHALTFAGGDLGAFLNGLNASWVEAARRLSPRLLIEMHELIGAQVLDFWKSQDPHAPAFFPVAWAGETESEMWFDCARDFTEHWHHQQQIREAAGAASLICPVYYPTVLSILMRCVPVAYAGVDAGAGTAVQITASGDAGGDWTLSRSETGWDIRPGRGAEARAAVCMEQRDLWLLFTKKLPPEEAAARATIEGDSALVRPFFLARAIMG
jgi:uncharacterized protein (TIGR03083 family)